MRIMEKLSSNMQKFYAVRLDNGEYDEDYSCRDICYFRTFDDAKSICDALTEELKNDIRAYYQPVKNYDDLFKIAQYWGDLLYYFELNRIMIDVVEVELCICGKEPANESN